MGRIDAHGGSAQNEQPRLSTPIAGARQRGGSVSSVDSSFVIDSDDWRGLMFAARGGNDLDVLRLLTNTSIDVNETTKTGATALYIASQNGHTKVTTHFLKN